MKRISNSHIILMKAGPYCGYDLDEIIEIKQREEELTGKFLWGYGGVFCRPKVVIAFVSHALLTGRRPFALFSTTSSAYDTADAGRFTEYSIDGIDWLPLSKDVLLVGNVNAPHTAIVAQRLRRVEAKVDLGEYCRFSGFLPDPETYLNDYFRYRVDKACAFYLPRADNTSRFVNVSYVCELVEPFCVSVR